MALARAGAEPPLARLQDEIHEDQIRDYEHGKPHQHASEHAEQLTRASGAVRAVRAISQEALRTHGVASN